MDRALRLAAAFFLYVASAARRLHRLIGSSSAADCLPKGHPRTTEIRESGDPVLRSGSVVTRSRAASFVSQRSDEAIRHQARR
jgi:hypothetical protein